MARFQTQSSPLMTVFVMGTLLAAMSRWGSALPVAAPPLNNMFLQECTVKIAACGVEVFNGVFKNATVSPICCHKLVYMGKACHEGLVEHLISQPFFKGNKEQVLASAQRVWDLCVAIPF